MKHLLSQEQIETLLKSDVEIAIGFDDTGEFRFTIMGEKSYVLVMSPHMNLISNGTFVHSHPTGTSFSPADWDFGLFYDVKVLQVYTKHPTTGERYCDTMTLPTDENNRRKLRGGAMTDELNKIHIEILKREQTSDLTVDQINVIHWEAVWNQFQQIAHNHGITEFSYKREIF